MSDISVEIDEVTRMGGATGTGGIVKAPSPRARRLFAVAAVILAVVLLAGVVSAVAVRLPRTLSADEVAGTWRSESLAGVITFADDGELTISNLGVNFLDPFGNDSDFDASGTWTLSDTTNTVSIQLAAVTIDGVSTSVPTMGSALNFTRESGEAKLFVMDFTTEQPYYFSRR